MLGGGRKRYRFYSEERTAGGRLWSLVKLLILLFVLYELVTTFLISSYRVDSEAMRPVLEPGDRVLVTSLPVGADMPVLDTRGPSVGGVRRADVVLVRTGYGPVRSRFVEPVGSLLRFFTGQSRSVAEEDWRPEVTFRRVIGVPGDTVRMEDFIFYVRGAGADTFSSEFEASGARYPLIRDGNPESWAPDFPFGEAMDPIDLGDGRYFLAGDNRPAAIDSRHQGPVEEGRVLSRVIIRYWPFRRFGVPGR
jgi:signal peptidase I